MATNAYITVRTHFGYKSVYLHYADGAEYIQELLQEYYNSQAKAEALVSLGDLSVLDMYIDAPAGHSFDNPAPGRTVAYHRDRGEELRILNSEERPAFPPYYYHYYWVGHCWCSL